MLKYTERNPDFEIDTVQVIKEIEPNSQNEVIKNYLKLTVGGQTLRNWMSSIEQDVSKCQELSYYAISICLCFQRAMNTFITKDKINLLKRIMFSFNDGVLQPLGPDFVEYTYFFSVGTFPKTYNPPKDHLAAISIVFLILTGQNPPYLSHFELQPDFSSPYVPYPFKSAYVQNNATKIEDTQVCLADVAMPAPHPLNVVIHDYASILIADEPIELWLFDFTFNDDEAHDLAHYMIHICIIFKFLQPGFLDNRKFEILRRLFVSFQEERFRNLNINFIYFLYHYSVGRYGNCTEDVLSETYLQVIRPIFTSLIANQTPRYIPYYLDPDLETELCPYPFEEPFIMNLENGDHEEGPEN